LIAMFQCQHGKNRDDAIIEQRFVVKSTLLALCNY